MKRALKKTMKQQHLTPFDLAGQLLDGAHATSSEEWIGVDMLQNIHSAELFVYFSVPGFQQ